MAERVKMVRVRIIDKALRRYSADGIITLSEDQAASEVALGRVEYFSDTPTKTVHPTAIASKTKAAPDPAQQPGYLRRVGFAESGRGLRVAWVQDFSKMGGAELSNATVVQTGEHCGYDIVGVTPKRFDAAVLRAADVLVLNNVHEFSREQFDALRREMYELRKPWVKYEHDLRELHRQNISRPLFGGAVLAVFLSPAHAAAHAASLDLPECVEMLPLAVDVELFPCALASAVRSRRVLIPTLRKCGNALRQWAGQHLDLEYLIMGAGEAGSVLPEGAHVEGVPALTNARMHEVYHSVGTVVHLPEEPWAGERVVLEAKLCGCEVVVNSNVGHASWDWLATDSRDAIAERLAAAPYRFWRAVETALRAAGRWVERA